MIHVDVGFDISPYLRAAPLQLQLFQCSVETRRGVYLFQPRIAFSILQAEHIESYAWRKTICSTPGFVAMILLDLVGGGTELMPLTW